MQSGIEELEKQKLCYDGCGVMGSGQCNFCSLPLTYHCAFLDFTDSHNWFCFPCLFKKESGVAYIEAKSTQTLKCCRQISQEQIQKIDKEKTVVEKLLALQWEGTYGHCHVMLEKLSPDLLYMKVLFSNAPWMPHWMDFPKNGVRKFKGSDAKNLSHLDLFFPIFHCNYLFLSFSLVNNHLRLGYFIEVNEKTFSRKFLGRTHIDLFNGQLCDDFYDALLLEQTGPLLRKLRLFSPFNSLHPAKRQNL